MAAKHLMAKALVDSLYNAGVRYVFGIPGAKIDALFDELVDIPLIVCRHEQNAAFLAAATGLITGVPGVCMATSGPGAANLTTGLVTATTEGDPVVAIIGSVPRKAALKHTHQSMKATSILSDTAKSVVTIETEDQVTEAILTAFRTATTSPQGATVVDIPLDIAASSCKMPAFVPEAYISPTFGPAPGHMINAVRRMIETAKLPVLFLGQRASNPLVVSAIRKFLTGHPIPVVETFQAAGAIPHELASSVFFGRVGFFRNQVGDRLLAASDLIVTVGYDPWEYDTNQWNPEGRAKTVHIDPTVELLGSIYENITALCSNVTRSSTIETSDICRTLRSELNAWHHTLDTGEGDSQLIQPLHFVSALQERVSKDTTVTCDVGTVYLYIMRYFRAYEARRLLCSNGQQTLGIGMPWAIAASLAQNPPCSQKVVSISGDSGFMFSAQELSTAAQQGCNITHFLWNSNSYDMVEFQEELKYGRSSGIKLGGVDFVKLIEAFDGKRFRVNHPDELESTMDKALSHKGLSVVEVPIDYSRAADLMAYVIPDSLG
ncbi:hypothetical protein M409DRAFT_65137 [Zasmidium cellare ATCC 36951]|uniref:Uncharacterized protein n=1 Tax=Zasmidium cellare ATCC 36951 TaxID=1080233 RepID=A0A6A6CT98_ZASCE|nr:uncharacterized protein M409DRAFT_65137 [Zasmidium cellare ATCC 36951]KAF2168706.1 hypothetical protein M409DRAFT_65137 [Zasmidium cellare ATCC 36951]